MDWSQGYSAEWRVYEVNPETWADGEYVGGVAEVSIERDAGSTAPLLESGSIKMDGAGEFRERYLRVTMTAYQFGQAERVDVATLLCTQTAGNSDYGTDRQEILGRSVLYPASVRKLTRGTYAPKGVDGAEWAAERLREACRAPVEVEGGFTLDSHIVLDLGTSFLECAWAVLDAGGYCIQLGGDGTIYVRPMPTEASLILDESGAELLQPSIKYDYNTSKIPNRYTAVEDLLTATAENDDPNSPTSTVSRGYIYDVVDKSPKRVNGETLAAYAARKLEEQSRISDTRTYTREYYPGVLPFSLVRGGLNSIGVDGSLRVKTQSLTCGKGITVTEKAERGVYTWRR